MKKTITLEIDVNGKNMDADAQQAVMDAVVKAVEATAFSVVLKVQSPGPTATAPPTA